MKKETKVWYQQAEDDYKNGKLLAKSKSYRGAVLFAQQSVEKILKAYIIEYKNEIPRKTHRIEILIKDARLNSKKFNMRNVEQICC
ncbi:HEPN domain-containing protein [Candidatus Roizmanbacteria bacterium]|nr:HEPN domain-containing protein [Candidatus Roizmanbacteria bacterium]